MTDGGRVGRKSAPGEVVTTKHNVKVSQTAVNSCFLSARAFLMLDVRPSEAVEPARSSGENE